MSPPHVSNRDSWIARSSFHELSDPEVRELILRSVRSARSASRGELHPVVLFDLDSTLYDEAGRMCAILREWSQTPQSAEHPEARAAIARLAPGHAAYSVRRTLANAGLAQEHPGFEAALAAAREFLIPRFFSNEALDAFDRPYPGAARFVADVNAAGARVVYLTGRNEPGMGAGTRRVLARDGFPLEDGRTRLFMKPSPELQDTTYKSSAAEGIGSLGPLIASFENEPVNLVALRDRFPSAMHVFVDTIASDREAAPRQGLYRIRGYED